MPNHTITRPQRPHRHRYLAGTALLAVVGLAASCSDTAAIDAGDFSVQSHIGQLPVESTPPLLLAGDLEAAGAAAGLTRPQDATGEDGQQWLLGLTVDVEYEVFVPLPSFLMTSFGQPGGDELGWDLTDVHTFAHIDTPPQQSLIVTGDFDEDTLAEDLEDLGEGVYSAGSGADQEVDPAGGTPLRPLGMPLRVARDGGAIMVDNREQAVRDWLTGADRDTAADHAAIMDVAGALDDQGVYAAVIHSPAGPLELPAQVEGATITEPFEALGIGWAMDGSDPVVAVSYAFSDADAAQRALDQVRAVWTEGRIFFTGQDVAELYVLQDVTQDEHVVSLTVHLGEAGQPQHAFDMIQRQDVTTGYVQP